MLSILKGRTQTTAQAGIGFHPDGISVAVVDRPRGTGKTLTHCSFHPAQGSEAQLSELMHQAAQLRLKATPSVFVMEPGSYSLVQMEAPHVEPNEVRAAVRWRIKDLIDFHIDDATIDVFDLPIAQRGGSARLMYAVVARTSLIQERVDLINRAGINLLAIDVTELCLRNIAALLSSDQGAVAMLYLSPHFGMIEISQESVLFLTRRIEISATDFSVDSTINSGNFGEPLLDTLVLEIQRSLDHYESQYGQGTPSAVLVVPCSGDTSRLVQYVGENLAVGVEPLALTDELSGLDEVSADDLSLCLPAIGAALRA